MAQHEIEILQVVKMPSTATGRTGQPDTVVFFLRDKNQTDFISIPGDVSDLREIQQAIAKELDARSNLTGQKFTV